MKQMRTKPGYQVIDAKIDTVALQQLLSMKYTDGVSYEPKIAVVDFGSAFEPSVQEKERTAIPLTYMAPDATAAGRLLAIFENWEHFCGPIPRHYRQIISHALLADNVNIEARFPSFDDPNKPALSNLMADEELIHPNSAGSAWGLSSSQLERAIDKLGTDNANRLIGLLCAILKWMPEERLSVEQIINHPFFGQY
ncbi:hypothetical protein B0T26DRAFT_753601 [Lasiosphaeria miniovina]|uniref:Protein kinase domain-containing protein n=1 Tax=Lasiosphaeria miniovina TaxID=1954250 RepID=A0AA40ACS1_9PEZI|nr:uncharacterized protein B0T26DRAFT_753601 [Lasiosphaeria miniovina]KAK0713502.1 hypothetical protein B0T26DRAFT_753601 [Lasiosphaeria miniovina]